MESIVPIFQTEKLESYGGKATFLNLQNFQVSGLGWPGSTLGFFHWDTWLSAWQTGQSKLQSKVQSDALTIPGDSSLASREVFLEASLSASSSLDTRVSWEESEPWACGLVDFSASGFRRSQCDLVTELP